MTETIGGLNLCLKYILSGLWQECLPTIASHLNFILQWPWHPCLLSQTLLTSSYYFLCTSWPLVHYQTSFSFYCYRLHPPSHRCLCVFVRALPAFWNVLHSTLHLLCSVSVVQCIYLIFTSLNRTMDTMLITNEYYLIIKPYQISNV